MQQTEAGDTVARILDEPLQCQHVLDVGGVEILQSAELHERDVPARELDFKRPAVAGCPEQNGLLFEERAGSRFSRMRSTIKRAWSASSQTVTSCGLAPDVRSVQRFLVKRSLARPMTPLAAARTAIIAIERDDVGQRRELVGKVQDVAHGCGAERIDRLGAVADDRQAAASGLERQQDRRLQPVRVLLSPSMGWPALSD